MGQLGRGAESVDRMVPSAADFLGSLKRLGASVSILCVVCTSASKSPTSVDGGSTPDKRDTRLRRPALHRSESGLSDDSTQQPNGECALVMRRQWVRTRKCAHAER